MEEITFKGIETICIFTDYLIVLFFNWVIETTNKIQEFFLFEKFGLVLLDLLLHFWSFIVIWKLFRVKLCELYGFFRLLSLFLLF